MTTERLPIRFGAPALVLALLCVALPSVGAQDAELPTAAPATVGFSPERLAALDAPYKKFVDDGSLSGIVTLVARHGKVVASNAYGYQDLEKKTPMRQDAIFRIYSMTKPITGVAMMKLYEQGKWHPDDPLSRFIPEFANLQVYAGTDAAGNVKLEKPAHPPTVGEVMTHTAGFTYGFFGDTPVDKQYRADSPLSAPTLQAFVDKVARIPLLYQPGTQWVYSVSVDIQGHLVEKLSGKSLPDYLQQEIFGPLGMRDTSFAVPAEKLDRLATIYRFDQKAGLTPNPRDSNISTIPGMASGGGGLYSTARDYARFAQMLANGGVLNGAQDSRAQQRVADARQPPARLVPRQGLRRRPAADPAGRRLRLRRGGVRRSAQGRQHDRHGHVSLGRRRRHVVLDRSRQRHRLRRDGPANDGRERAGAPEPVTRARAAGAPGALTCRARAPHRTGSGAPTTTRRRSSRCRTPARCRWRSPGR